jgi:hypothetical protein
LPLDWWEQVESEHLYGSPASPLSKDFACRGDAEDAAALAFTRLPAVRRAELLAAPHCSGE